MTIFILFILIAVIGAHAYNTRQKLINVANMIDAVHLEIDRSLADKERRIGELEDAIESLESTAKKRRTI